MIRKQYVIVVVSGRGDRRPRLRVMVNVFEYGKEQNGYGPKTVVRPGSVLELGFMPRKRLDTT